MKSTKCYQFGNPIKLAFRKHLCLYCGENLEIGLHSIIINSKSPEAKYYDFSYGETSHIKLFNTDAHYLNYRKKYRWMENMYKKLILLKKQKPFLFIPFLNAMVVICAVINYFKLRRVLPIVLTAVAYVILSGVVAACNILLHNYFDYRQVALIMFGVLLVTVYLFAIASYIYQKHLFKVIEQQPN